jgi:hypothetical protein
VWFLGIYLISQAKTGLSALALKRHLGVSYPTAWLIHHKLMRAMEQREERYVLDGQVQVDDAYLGGERTGGKAGRGSENKVPFVAAVSFSEEGHPLRAKLTLVPGFTLKAIAEWAKSNLAPGSTVLSDGLACFNAVTDAGCVHQPTVARRAKAQGPARVQVGQHGPGQSQDQPFGLLPRACLSKIWRSVPRGIHLPLPPPIRSQDSERAAPGRCGSLRAAASALDSGG